MATTRRISQVDQILTNRDLLNVIFNFAGDWNSAVPLVSRIWHEAFQKNLSVQWQLLEKTAGPELMRKMRTVKECNGDKTAPRILFKDLYELLKEIAPPREEPRLTWIAAFAARIFVKNQANKGIISEVFKKQKAANVYNEERVLHAISTQYYRSFKTIWDASLKINLSNLDLSQAGITELPAAVLSVSLRYLHIHGNHYLNTLPLEIMEIPTLESLCLDPKLFEKLPDKMARHLERKASLGQIHIEYKPAEFDEQAPECGPPSSSYSPEGIIVASINHSLFS